MRSNGSGRRRIAGGLIAILVGHGPMAPQAAAQALPDAVEQLRAELDYLTHSSWTQENPHSVGWGWFDAGDDIHGALNDVRVPVDAPPDRVAWVEPAIVATAAIGMMQGVRYLHDRGLETAPYAAVLDKLFRIWVLAHRQGQNLDPGSPDFGAFMTWVDYDSRGRFATGSPVWKTDVTALVLTASWKYAELLAATGRPAEADEWVAEAWPIGRNAADYLVRMHDETPAGAIHLLPGNSTEPHYGTWVHFAAYAVPALRAASVWARRVGAPHASYDRVAADLVLGLESMKDPGPRSIYRRYVPWRGDAYGAPTYGSGIDQLTFVPVEAGAVAVDGFAARISDWFTEGEPGIAMTHPTRDPGDWRHFGTHWKWSFAGAPENDLLYPGPGFQLAKVEWKYGVASGDPVYVERSRRRLDWGRRPEYSALWWFATAEEEAATPNGFVDWRDGTDYSNRGETWSRFVDTSAYFIEVLLMHEAGIDTDYNPEPLPCAGDADADGVCDLEDNCAAVPNADQRDTNRDGYGNLCDMDVNDDGRIGGPDYLALGSAFAATRSDARYDEDLDADGDGVIGAPELLLLGASWLRDPGPSGLACAGSPPCPLAP